MDATTHQFDDNGQCVRCLGYAADQQRLPGATEDGATECDGGAAARANKHISFDAVVAVMEREGDWAHDGDPRREATRWTALGFDADAVSEWLDARCFDATAAKQLRDAGVTPAQAGKQTGRDVGLGGYADTVAYKLSNGDLSLARAVQLVAD